MAGQSRNQTDHLIRALSEKPFAYDFYRAMRMLQCAYRDQPRIGTSDSPREDPLRFGQKPFLQFAPASLQAFDPGADGRAARLFVYFFGLLGPNGPMPLRLTEFMIDRARDFKDPTLAHFLDVFHHRMLSFFFRAWAASSKTADFDRPDEQRFTAYIGSSFGLGTEAVQNRDEVPDWAKLFYAGREVMPTRNVEGLQAILGDFFEIPAQVLTFVGQWLPVPANSICQLGQSPLTGRIGSNAIVGSRFWECQLKFRVRFGPMSLKDYERMLPGGRAFKRLKAWVLNYLGEQFFWDAQLVLRAEEVPEIQLGTFGRLGWTTWLKTRAFESDADNLALESQN